VFKLPTFHELTRPPAVLLPARRETKFVLNHLTFLLNFIDELPARQSET
jgi:hypothetical protein